MCAVAVTHHHPFPFLAFHPYTCRRNLKSARTCTCAVRCAHTYISLDKNDAAASLVSAANVVTEDQAAENSAWNRGTRSHSMSMPGWVTQQQGHIAFQIRHPTLLTSLLLLFVSA